MDTTDIQIGDLVVDDTFPDEVYRVLKLFPVFGIPYADLVRVRKDDRNWNYSVRVKTKSLPVSVLRKTGEEN